MTSLETSLAHHVYRPAQCLGEVHLQGTEVEEAAARSHLDQEIDIAAGSGLMPRHRPKDPHPRSPMPRGQRQEPLSLSPKLFERQRIHSCPPIAED